MVERGVAYHGNVYLDHARSDFKEMQDHGCNSVLLAMSEYDYDQWRGQYFKMAKIAKEEFGFTVYLNFWAWGRVFGGEAPSFFLNNNALYRQIFSKTQEPFPAACFNTKIFQNYIKKAIKKMAASKEIDGFFWDEPHFAYSPENILPLNLTPYYVCYCTYCQKLFYQQFHEKMPQEEDQQVLIFKERSLVQFLQELCQTVKKIDSSKSNTICVMPSHARTGISDWSKICFEEMDVLATDPYWMIYQKDLTWVREEAEELVSITKKYHKRSQLWVLAFAIAEGRESEIKDACHILKDSGVDSIFAWLYRGGLQTLLKSANPPLVWQILGEAYNRIK